MILRGADWDIAPVDRSIASRLGGVMPTPIARLRTDGGTTFCIRTDASDWHPEFIKTVDWLVNMTAEERRRRKTNPVVGLPLPSIPAFADSLQLDPRMLGWADEARDSFQSPRVPVEAWVTGGDNPCVHFHAHDRAFVTMYKRKDADGIVKWECRLQAKAPELYADGLNLWMVRWLGLFGWLLAGKFCPPSESHKLGWRTTQWHLNSDFTGLHMVTNDAWNVLGWMSGRCYGNGQTAEERREKSHLSAFQKANPYFASTLYLGRTTSDTCVVVYKKSEQLEDEARVSPQSSIYAPEWKRNGWDEEEDITRVELRLRKKALVYVDPKTKDIVYDFRDPALLLVPEARRHLWEYVTAKRRLVCPESEKSRLTRAPIDPAWLSVVRLGFDAPGKSMRQVPHEVRAMTRTERVAKAKHQAMLAAVKIGCQHGAVIANWHDVGATLMAMGKQMLEGGEPEEMNALPRVVDFSRVGDYARQTSVFFKGEADAHFEDFEADVGRELKRVDWSKVSGPEPPRESEPT